MQKRLHTARQHVWNRWRNESIHGLMEPHRIMKGEDPKVNVGEVVLVIGEEKNRGQWKKGKVLRVIKGRDGILRGVVLLDKRHEIERPIQLVCPLKVRSEEADQTK